MTIIAVARCTATSCSYPPPCGYVRPGAVFFVGTLIGDPKPLPQTGTAPKPPIGEGPPHESRFRVDEALFGLDETTTEVVVITPGAWFKAGHRGLVHGGRSGKVIRTSICGATALLDAHDAIIRYLRELNQGKGETTSTVRVVEAGFRPVEGATVTLAGEQRVTDADGIARFDAVKPGTYTVNAAKAGFVTSARYTSQPVDVVFGGCGSTTTFLTATSVVTGQVLDSTGSKQPRTLLKLEADPGTAPGDPKYARTDADGHFRFNEIPPGRYILSTDHTARGTTWFPGRTSRAEATPIVVDAGHDLTGLQFTLPPSGTQRTLTIRVVHESGAPVTDLDILDWSQGAKPGSCTLGSLGRREQIAAGALITRTVFDGVCYRIRAFERTKEPGQYYASDPADIGPITGDLAITLVLKNVLPARPR